MTITNSQLTTQETQLLLDLGIDSRSPTLATPIQDLIGLEQEQESLLDLFPSHRQNNFVPCTSLEFSAEARTVFDAGRELWGYYHSQPNCKVNASLYDIREYFQGRNET